MLKKKKRKEVNQGAFFIFFICSSMFYNFSTMKMHYFCNEGRKAGKGQDYGMILVKSIKISNIKTCKNQLLKMNIDF